MSTAYGITFAALVVAAILVLARVLFGPSTLDRIVAFETFVVLIVAGIATEIARSGHTVYVAVLLVVALVGFIGSLTAVQLIEGRGRHR